MQLNQVKYFLAACDSLNFTRASENCNVSQPALTVAIARLEEELGGALFDRRNRRLSLTDFGATMKVHFERMDDARKQIASIATQYFQPSGKIINIGLMCTVGPERLFRSLHSWFESNRHVELLFHDVTEHSLEELLVSKSVDCALVSCSQPLSARFSSMELEREPMVVAMSRDHVFAEQDVLMLADLQKTRYIDRLGCEFRSRFYRELGRRELTLNTAMRSVREDWVARAVANGLGVTVMPQEIAESFGLTWRVMDDFPLARTIELISLAGLSATPEIDAFVQLVEQAWSSDKSVQRLAGELSRVT